MTICQNIRRKRRRVCTGDLDTQIVLNDRNIGPPVFGVPDYTEEFSPVATVWALVETTNGKTFFNGVDTETPITHNIYIVFDATITAETWVQLDNERNLDILNVEDLDERKEFMLLVCVDRGLISKDASKA